MTDPTNPLTYQVLSPDSVAWHILAALVADRMGNEAARDLALAEAQRIAQERRLVERPCYDCRTTGERLNVLERRVEFLSGADRAQREWNLKTARIENRLAALEARPAFSMHQQQRMDDIEAKLRDTAHRLEQVYVDHAETRSRGNRQGEILQEVIIDCMAIENRLAALETADDDYGDDTMARRERAQAGA